MASRKEVDSVAGKGNFKLTSDKVVELLNQAQLAPVDQKIVSLKQVQELIINKEPALLDNFLDEILIFQQDRSADIRKFVVVFAEEACKKDPELLTKIIGCLSYMLGDENINVVKRVMLACNSLYKISLQLVCKVRTIKEDFREMWEKMSELKRQICGMIESENDGVRTHAIKFMEMLILVHSLRSQDEKSKKDDISLDIVPANHPLVKYEDLVDEGMTTLEALLALCASASISSVNLMAVLSSLTSIGRQRPLFLSTVIQSFESLHANLPQTLSKSQVSSVRKNLKLQLFTLIRLPSAESFLTQIGTLLTDLGATGAEIQKSLPKLTDAESRKRRATGGNDLKSVKKIKTEDKSETGQFSLSKAIELTTSDIAPKLSNAMVTDLVLVSMLFLPRNLPSHFQETFTPIAAAGSSAQIEHLARLMATQMTNAGVGVGVEMAKQFALSEKKNKPSSSSTDIPKEQPKTSTSTGTEHQHEKNALNKMLSTKQTRSMKDIASDLKSGAKQNESTTRLRKIKPFRLQDVVQHFRGEQGSKMLHFTYKRILNSFGKTPALNTEQHKIIVGLAIQFYEELTDDLVSFIMEDFRSRIDLCILWLYQQYVKEESFLKGVKKEEYNRYSLCLDSIVDGIKKHLEPRDKLFTRFILEAPSLTDNIRKVIKEYCVDTERIMVGFSTLRELISKAPAQSQTWLQLLLELTTAEKEQVRVQAIHSAKKLHSRPDFSEAIEDFALHSLQQLLLEVPPFKDSITDDVDSNQDWTEESIKAYLYLYLALLPTNHGLFLNLAEVYVDAPATIKRTILRHLEHPVRAIGMNSPELLRLVENCPTGAETLVTRVLHIVTDKSPPTPELVQKVKDLYHKRVSDVRFLIPVLNGLRKNEIIEVLPKLISQTPNVVKEVFNRLLATAQGVTVTPPLSPSELLVALHSIEAKSDVKAIMKAINICFGEKEIYTQEVLAVVIQQLMEISPLPTLFMRTVIQSLGMCPRLVGFVMNILSKLIGKQVWKFPKVWQGFIKCCQMTKPQSFPVLLQLPPKQLENVLEAAPDMKEALITHVDGLSANQRSHIPKSLLHILQTDTKESLPTDPNASYSANDKRKRKLENTTDSSKAKKKL